MKTIKPKKTLSKEERIKLKDRFIDYKNKDITLTDISEEFGLSLSGISRIFIKEFGDRYRIISKTKSSLNCQKITKEISVFIKEEYDNKKSCEEIKKSVFNYYNIIISSGAVRNSLLRNGIKLRNPREAIIINHRNKEPVNEIIKLYGDKLSIREISRKLNIGRLTIKKILKENNIKIRQSREALIFMNHIQEKEKFDLSQNEKAYLFGLVGGDLTPFKKSNYTLGLITHTTHKDFADLMLKSFEKYGIAGFKLNKRNEFRFQAYLDFESFSFLLDSKKSELPNWINNKNFYYYLAGFIDSDGSIFIKKCGKYFQFCIRFFGENLEILKEIKIRLEKLEYSVSIHKNHSEGDFSYYKGKMIKYNFDYYVIELQNKNKLIDLLNKLPIRHPEKIARKQQIFDIAKTKVYLWEDIANKVIELRKLIKESVKLRTNLKD